MTTDPLKKARQDLINDYAHDNRGMEISENRLRGIFHNFAKDLDSLQAQGKEEKPVECRCSVKQTGENAWILTRCEKHMDTPLGFTTSSTLPATGEEEKAVYEWTKVSPANSGTTTLTPNLGTTTLPQPSEKECGVGYADKKGFRGFCDLQKGHDGDHVIHSFPTPSPRPVEKIEELVNGLRTEIAKEMLDPIINKLNELIRDRNARIQE